MPRKDSHKIVTSVVEDRPRNASSECYYTPPHNENCFNQKEPIFIKQGHLLFTFVLLNESHVDVEYKYCCFVKI